LEYDHVLELLESNYLKYNNPAFIENDPISIPHLFTSLQDIEISGFFAATLAWGLRKTIINKSMELMQLFDFAPYDFIKGHSDDDLKPLLNFKHRTFNATDLLYFIHFLKECYSKYNSLEEIFRPVNNKELNVKNGINKFNILFTSDEYFPARTGKHLASPSKNSACKRINMFLRWMVRTDEHGVDFGIWKNIKPNQLICPCDVHVERIARKLGLITRKQIDWKLALQLTENLKKLDPIDPVKYYFALFGIGIHQERD